MPTYDYRCDACGHELELFQSITASPKKKCPGCGRLKLRRVIGTGAGIIFKGSGFYETDYRSESYKADARKDSSASASGSKDSSAGDAKPAKKKAADTPKPASDSKSDSGKSKGDA